MFTDHKSALIIFAREPELGRVKTRLAKDVGDQNALNLYKAFVKQTLSIVSEVQCGQKFIYYAGHEKTIPFLRQFESDFILREQAGRDLGERMFKAICDAKESGFSQIIIIGTDCLTITAQEISLAFKKLKEYQCVIGPADDGGYYLLGLQNPEKNLFAGIPWSGSSVYNATMQAIQKLDWKVYQMPIKEDIDNIDSLRRVFETLQKNKTSFPGFNIIQNIFNSGQ